MDQSALLHVTAAYTSSKIDIDEFEEKFEKEGYVLIRGALSRSDVAFALKESMRGIKRLKTKYVDVVQKALAGGPNTPMHESYPGWLSSCFADFTERDAGRYELQLPDLQEAAGPYAFLQTPPWLPLVNSSLGGTFQLISISIVLATKRRFIGNNGQVPGELGVDQEYHKDGPGPEPHPGCKRKFKCHGRRYAVTVWLPLSDVGPRDGALEVIPGTQDDGDPPKHLLASYTKRVEQKQGDIVLWDWRVTHRGLRKLSKGFRPVVKLDYAVPGFEDDVNKFCHGALLPDSLKMQPKLENPDETQTNIEKRMAELGKVPPKRRKKTSGKKAIRNREL